MGNIPYDASSGRLHTGIRLYIVHASFLLTADSWLTGSPDGFTYAQGKLFLDSLHREGVLKLEISYLLELCHKASTTNQPSRLNLSKMKSLSSKAISIYVPITKTQGNAICPVADRVEGGDYLSKGPASDFQRIAPSSSLKKPRHNDTHRLRNTPSTLRRKRRYRSYPWFSLQNLHGPSRDSCMMLNAGLKCTQQDLNGYSLIKLKLHTRLFQTILMC
ncbi:unnamed protein product [Protopolystoma xenopodis]|uniref:Uncharacterized protein n=1 Tax=Protopolystoma xenopodis TaxID=117903 RepID=A0A3S5ASL9_9PLAT|nr:unnamed protein product [Protopolystoma xenopodis]